MKIWFLRPITLNVQHIGLFFSFNFATHRTNSSPPTFVRFILMITTMQFHDNLVLLLQQVKDYLFTLCPALLGSVGRYANGEVAKSLLVDKCHHINTDYTIKGRFFLLFLEFWVICHYKQQISAIDILPIYQLGFNCHCEHWDKSMIMTVMLL